MKLLRFLFKAPSIIFNFQKFNELLAYPVKYFVILFILLNIILSFALGHNLFYYVIKPSMNDVFGVMNTQENITLKYIPNQGYQAVFDPNLKLPHIRSFSVAGDESQKSYIIYDNGDHIKDLSLQYKNFILFTPTELQVKYKDLKNQQKSVIAPYNKIFQEHKNNNKDIVISGKLFSNFLSLVLITALFIFVPPIFIFPLFSFLSVLHIIIFSFILLFFLIPVYQKLHGVSNLIKTIILFFIPNLLLQCLIYILFPLSMPNISLFFLLSYLIQFVYMIFAPKK